MYGQAQFDNINLDTVTLTTSQGFNILGITGSYCGFSVNTAGDVNNDGYPDIIIGAPYANNQAGESYVLYGNALLSSISLDNLGSNQGFYITGAQEYAQSGYSVAGAGDINGDGYDDVIIGAPNSVYDNSIAGAAFVIYGADSGFITLSPTSLPTTLPTASSKLDTQWWNTIEFKEASSIALSILSFTAAWLFRNKIAVYFLNNWGHKYILYSPYLPLKEDEIALKLSLKNELICIAKYKEYILLDSENDDYGISKSLYGTIIHAIDNPSMSQSFMLYQDEKNQIRDYLIAHKYIKPTQTFCCLKGYRELGYIQGTIYNLFLKNFELEHFKASKKHVRTDNSNQVSVDILSINIEKTDGLSTETIATSNSIYDLSLDGSFSAKSKKDSSPDDVENPLHHRISTMEISRHDTQSLSTDQKNPSKSSCIILSIDAMMNPEHVRSQNAEFIRFGEHLTIAYKDLSSVFCYKNDQAQILLEDSSTKTDALTIHQKFASTDSPPFTASDNLMISLFTTKQLIEYLPIIKYTVQGTINYIGYNITLPDITDYKPLLISTHLVVGNIAAQLLPTESITNGMIVSTIGSGSYAMRLTAIDYLKNQEVADNPVDLAKQCGTTIAAYTLPNLATCALTKLILPEMPCANTGMDVLTSGSLGAMQCYSNYKATAQPSDPTTADVVVPYIADAIAAYTLSGYFGIDTSSSSALMMSIKNSMSVMAAVVATDSLSIMVMDVVPQEVKVDYIDPILDCVGDLYACFASNNLDWSIRNG